MLPMHKGFPCGARVRRNHHSFLLIIRAIQSTKSWGFGFCFLAAGPLILKGETVVG